MYPKKFEALVECYRRLPGVGIKTAERYAFQTLEWDDETMDSWIHAFQNAKEGLKKCAVCGNLSEDDTCDICGDQSRNSQIICVVQSPKDVIAMEKTKEYSGVYQETEEIIIATNPTVEGETTALYLSKLLEKYPVTVTRIAHGLPMGGHLDYADELTLIKAIEGRKKMEP